MSKSPAFQFYAAEYLADENVAVMTLEEEGAYIRAIAYCWREGSIPAEDERLSRLLKGASNQTLRVVRECFNQMPTDSTRLVHPRLEKEREKQALWAAKSAQGGKASGKSRRDKKFHAEPPFANGSGLVEPKGNSSSSSSSSSSKEKTHIDRFVLPPWIDKQTWRDFEEMRNRKKAPMTDRARRNILLALEDLRSNGNEANAVLNQSITECWKGVFPLKGEANGSNRDQGRGERIIQAAQQAIQNMANREAGRGWDGAAGERGRGNAGVFRGDAGSVRTERPSGSAELFLPQEAAAGRNGVS